MIPVHIVIMPFSENNPDVTRLQPGSTPHLNAMNKPSQSREESMCDEANVPGCMIDDYQLTREKNFKDLFSVFKAVHLKQAFKRLLQ